MALIETDYFHDFLAYYDRASILQVMNIGSEAGRDVNEHPCFDDPLMQYITIYDCVERRYAGFSNALQQIWYGSKNPKAWQALDEFDGLHRVYTELEWMFLFLVHRLTGSGASFSQDHGFRNSIIADTCRNADQAGDMKRYILDQMRAGRPIFTSIGNQIPPFKAVPPHAIAFKRPGEYYISEYAPGLALDTLRWLQSATSRRTVADVADFACQWHRTNGLKQFKFVLTAWAMDLAEYYPEYVDPMSRCHYGKNALESLDLMFELKGKRSYDQAMERICDVCIAPLSDDVRGRPYSLEDCLCDFVRYLEHFVPKGYGHLAAWQIENSSTVSHSARHASYYEHLKLCQTREEPNWTRVSNAEQNHAT